MNFSLVLKLKKRAGCFFLADSVISERVLADNMGNSFFLSCRRLQQCIRCETPRVVYFYKTSALANRGKILADGGGTVVMTVVACRWSAADILSGERMGRRMNKSGSVKIAALLAFHVVWTRYCCSLVGYSFFFMDNVPTCQHYIKCSKQKRGYKTYIFMYTSSATVSTLQNCGTWVSVCNVDCGWALLALIF